MPRDLTKAENLAEQIRCDSSLLQTWVNRGDKARRDKLINDQLSIIESAERAIAEIDNVFKAAPERVAFYTQRVKDARQALAQWNNRGSVDRIKSLAGKVKDMQADLAALALTDPAMAEALRGQLKGIGL